MKLGFSSLVCPTWPLDSIMDVAKDLGYDGIELRGLRGQLDLTRSPELAGKPDEVKGRLEGLGLDLVCLGTSASFTCGTDRELQESASLVRSHIDLASQVGAHMVRVFSGDRAGRAPEAISRAGGILNCLGTYAAERGVTLVVENVGDLAGSEDLWLLLDAADSAAVRACWNPINGLCMGERPTLSIPRLGARLGLVHLADAKMGEYGQLDGFVPLGSGDLEVERLINLLRGIGYAGYIVFEWPKLWQPELPEPDAVLARFREIVSAYVNAEHAVLTAYKGDKKAPKFRLTGS